MVSRRGKHREMRGKVGKKRQLVYIGTSTDCCFKDDGTNASFLEKKKRKGKKEKRSRGRCPF